jgi:hypothetical protein
MGEADSWVQLALPAREKQDVYIVPISVPGAKLSFRLCLST